MAIDYPYWNKKLLELINFIYVNFQEIQAVTGIGEG
jgi:hypothetical protein